MVTRRRLLRSIGVMSSIPWTMIRQSRAAGARVPRLFDWNDAFQRSNVEAAAISVQGLLAVQVTRPLSAGGVYGGFPRRDIQPRGEIWLLDPSRREAHPLDLGSAWAWAPSFSPSGAFLAALISRGDGRVGIVVWDTRTRRERAHLDAHVDIDGAFGWGQGVEARPSREGYLARQFLWSSDETLLFMQADTFGPQLELDLISADRTFPRLHQRTAAGLASVRVWDLRSPVCRANGSVACLNWRTGQVTVIFRGAVRGVSLSPDQRWLVVLSATGHARLPSGAMPPGLFSTGIADDPLVILAACVISMDSPGSVRWVGSFKSVGVAAPRRLPRWSAASDRFAIPARQTFSSQVSSGDDSCWCIDVETLLAHEVPASSALDAELIATLYSAVPPHRLDGVLRERPSIGQVQHASLPVGGIPGTVWAQGKNVLLWDRRDILGFDGDRWRRVLQGCQTVFPPTVNPEPACALVLLDDGTACVIRSQARELEIKAIAWKPDWEPLGMRGAAGDVLIKCDTDRGTGVFRVSPAGSHDRSLLTLNQHFSHLPKPVVREIKRSNPDGRPLTGVLQLPFTHRTTRRHPVILWAYPNSEPTLDRWVTRPNTDRSVWMPLQYLLTQGFAVFHAPLRMPAGAKTEPLQFLVDSVLPWLEVLNAQPDILPGEFGFFGHSDAGIVALALEALTQQFKAISAYCTFPDFGVTPLSAAPANVALDCGADLIQANRFFYEDPTQPYGLGTAFWVDTERYLRNSSLYRMQSATTPLLLLQSEFDYGSRAMESVYSILHGRGIPVELAYYWGEGHLLASPGNLTDMWERTGRFFRKYLRRES